MRRSLLPVLAALALLVGSAWPASAASQTSCAGLPPFEAEIVAVGLQWLEDTHQAGVSYTANPLEFDSAHWSTFASLASVKRDNLLAIDPPPWLDAWLEIQTKGATLQMLAGNAVAQHGLEALQPFGDDFIDLVQRDERTTELAVQKCAAFALVAATWRSLNRDFEPSPGTPVSSWNAISAKTTRILLLM